jgi:hypothetical protein
VLGEAMKVHSSSGVLDTDKHVDPLAQDGVDMQEVDRENAASLGGKELSPTGSVRRGADGRPAWRRMVRTVVGERRWPSPSSSRRCADSPSGDSRGPAATRPHEGSPGSLGGRVSGAGSSSVERSNCGASAAASPE